MTERAPDRKRSGIDIPKTIAGALAAVCAAVIGSFLGVAGTLIGAALASIISSVGTEIYHRYLNKGAEKLQTLAVPAFVKVPAAIGTPAVAAASEEDSPSHTVPEQSPRNIRWGRVAMVAGALFVLAMGAISVTELITGKSVQSAVGHHTDSKTTLQGVFDSGDKKNHAPAPTPSASPTDTAPAAETPATSEPSTSSTSSAATEPTTEPTSAPQTPDSGSDQTAPADNPGGQDIGPGQGGQDIGPGLGGQDVVPGQGGVSSP
jgi:hypothetical protein